MGVSDAEGTMSYTTLMVTWCRSGLDFEAAGGSIICYYLSKHLL